MGTAQKRTSQDLLLHPRFVLAGSLFRARFRHHGPFASFPLVASKSCCKGNGTVWDGYQSVVRAGDTTTTNTE